MRWMDDASASTLVVFGYTRERLRPICWNRSFTSPWPSPERRGNRKSAAQAAHSLWERVGVRAQEFRQIRIGPSFGLNSES